MKNIMDKYDPRPGINATIERLVDDNRCLWDILSWIDTGDPETIAAAEAKFAFDLRLRAFKRHTP